MRLFIYLGVIVIGVILAAVDFNLSVVKRIEDTSNFAQSVRNYIGNQHYSEATGYPYNVPSYVAVSMMNDLNEIAKDMEYRELSLNPVNLANKANSDQTRIIEAISSHWQSTYRLKLDNSRVYIERYDPIRVEVGCLSCHGSAKNASDEQIEAYGDKNGFDYLVGDLYGVKEVAVDITWFVGRYIIIIIVFLVPGLMWLHKIGKKLDRALHVDSMSGAYNKNYYLKTKSEFLEGYVAIVDIDDFKRVNDSFGHHYGDLAIKQLSHILRGNCRASDWVYRFGGEEFVVLLRGKLTQSRLTELFDNVCQEVRDTSFGDERMSFNLTVSVGICSKAEGDNIDQIMEVADEALYSIKGSGKDGYMIQQSA